MKGPPPVAGPVEDPVRTAERLQLARELYDIVAHHLSNAALRTMGQLERTDRQQLQAVLEDVNRATCSALAELRLLAHVLEHEPGVVSPSGAVAGLSSRLVPSAAAERWRRRLVECGRLASYRVPEAADLLALSVQSTITRIFEATAELALAHAPVGTRCTTTIEVGPTEVAVHSRTMLHRAPAGHQLKQELTRELRGLCERVDLSQGRVAAGLGVAADEYHEGWLTVVLPLG